MGVITVAVLLAASVSSGQAQPVRKQAKDPPLVPDPLAWHMDVDEAMRTLQKANALPRRGDTRVYTSGPGPVTHTTNPTIYFVPRTGWTGEARFAYSTPDKVWRMQSVSYNASLSTSRLATEVAMLERRFGKPTKTVGPQRLWVRGGVWLVVFSPCQVPSEPLGASHLASLREVARETLLPCGRKGFEGTADATTNLAPLSVAYRRDDRPAP